MNMFDDFDLQIQYDELEDLNYVEDELDIIHWSCEE